MVAGIAFAILLTVSDARRAGFARADALFIAQTLGAWLATTTLIHLIYGVAAGRAMVPRRILLVGDPRRVSTLAARLRTHRGRVFHPVALRTPDITRPRLRLQRIWGVIVASEPEQPTLLPLLNCKLHGIKVTSAAAFQENYLGRIDLDALTATDILATQGFGASRLATTVKRLSDVIFASGMLLLLSPLMALTALAIKIDSIGPVFYRQPRVGQFDRPFTLLKFRGTTVDAEGSGSPLWAQRRDPKITRVGRFIRATRIDELPQLMNVLRGEMSMVGPRPECRHVVEQLARAIPFYRHRSCVKPGLTSWARINSPYGASVDDARETLAYDLYYMKECSFLLDIVILLSTVRMVAFREGVR